VSKKRKLEEEEEVGEVEVEKKAEQESDTVHEEKIEG
jgi:hypothetical protein